MVLVFTGHISGIGNVIGRVRPSVSTLHCLNQTDLQLWFSVCMWVTTMTIACRGMKVQVKVGSEVNLLRSPMSTG